MFSRREAGATISNMASGGGGGGGDEGAAPHFMDMERVGPFTNTTNQYTWQSEWGYNDCRWTLFRPRDAPAPWPPYPPQAFTEGPIAESLRGQRAEFQAAEKLVSNLAWRIRSRFENKSKAEGVATPPDPAISIKGVVVPYWMNHAIIQVEDVFLGTPPGGFRYKINAEKGELQYMHNRAGADTAARIIICTEHV